MENRSTGIRGELLRWARTEQELTMRQIRLRGGPSPGYQSEVEHLKKVEVRSVILRSWMPLLGVTERFARGQVPTYRDQPELCYGLAGDIGAMVNARQGEIDWQTKRAPERVRLVLQMIAARSQNLPRVVLAHVLGLSVKALDEMLIGSYPILPFHLQATSDLTRLPEAFFKHGLFTDPGPSEPMLGLIHHWEQAGVTLPDLLVVNEILPAYCQALLSGRSPGEIVDRINACLSSLTEPS